MFFARYLILIFFWSPLSAVDFPAPVDTQDTTDNPLPTAQESVAQFQLPPGFTATVFASEPQIRQPIGMAFDVRGRLWVAENYTYSQGKKIFDLLLNYRRRWPQRHDRSISGSTQTIDECCAWFWRYFCIMSTEFAVYP